MDIKMTEKEFIEILIEEKKRIDAIPFMFRKKKKMLRYNRRVNRKSSIFNNKK